MCTSGSSAHAALRNSFNPDPDSMIMDPKHRIYCMCDEFHWNNVCCYWEMIVPPGLKKGKTQIGLNNAVQCMSWNYVSWFSFSFHDNIVHSPLVRDFYWNRDGSKSASVISAINALFVPAGWVGLPVDWRAAGQLSCPHPRQQDWPARRSRRRRAQVGSYSTMSSSSATRLTGPGAAGEDELRLDCFR